MLIYYLKLFVSRKMEPQNLFRKVYRGDINGDGSVDLADAIVALKGLVGISSGDTYPNRDVNGDGKIGLQEVIYILQKVSGVREQ